MFHTPKTIAAACALAVVAAQFAAAGDAKPFLIRGKVISENGKPQGDAEIRALRLDAKAPEIIATTDAHGVYMLTNLPLGAYSITAFVDGFARSRAMIKTLKKGWANINFDLRLDAGDGGNRISQDLRGFGSATSHGGFENQ
jgi:hypothetical protein